MSPDLEDGRNPQPEVQTEKLDVLRQLLDQAERALTSARALISELSLGQRTRALQPLLAVGETRSRSMTGKVIEGVFDGHQMLGSDSRRYPVPPNYASKSKLVVGDVLKLTIADDGSFMFKQIGPVERKKLVGELIEERGRYLVAIGGKKYQLLPASVTYYRAKPGDRLTVIVPRDTHADWATIENNLS